MKVSDIDASAESAKTSNNNRISFFFNNVSDFFSDFNVCISTYEKYLSVSSNSLINLIVEYPSMLVNVLVEDECVTR